ncbi:DUF1365 domain-containing protein [Aliiroseovarius sp. YM-037]|uniref:DUF1365 domain-containing protein n=1 Tax=Aliiroseovarius sp. YM-037 TaxID=3341728 RepID=UPI003A803872
MSVWPEHIAGQTWHGRKGALKHAFRYGVDYVLIDPEAKLGPALFSRNGFNLTSVRDRNHGGLPGQGRGVEWVRDVLRDHGYDGHASSEIRLLTQPRFLGYIFNPVSFWLVVSGDDLEVVIAEVNNTFGDRHSYICRKPDFAVISPTDRITADKVMHVSPFQDVAGDYVFSFNIHPDRIAIRIDHRNDNIGVVATLTGERKPLTNRAILGASVRRPLGALRTIILIHWQALRLKLKGARYRTRPAPPSNEVT